MHRSQMDLNGTKLLAAVEFAPGNIRGREGGHTGHDGDGGGGGFFFVLVQ